MKKHVFAISPSSNSQLHYTRGHDDMDRESREQKVDCRVCVGENIMNE